MAVLAYSYRKLSWFLLVKWAPSALAKLSILQCIITDVYEYIFQLDLMRVLSTQHWRHISLHARAPGSGMLSC